MEEFLSTPSVRRATDKLFIEDSYACRFLSTPSVRRATRAGGHGSAPSVISIHALREEGDHRV